MHRFQIFTILLGIATITLSTPYTICQSTPKQGITKQEAGTSTQESSATDIDKQTSPVTVIVKQENAAPHQEGEGRNDEDIAINRDMARFNFYLVLVGLLQAAILGGTIFAIFRQTTSAKTAERAWIMVEVICTPNTDIGLTTSIVGDSEELGTMISSAEVRCTNAGRSPAWITSKMAKLIVISEESLPKFPPMLGEDDIIQYGPEPIGPEEVTTFEWRHPKGNGRHSIQTLTLVYGVVKYRDIFGKGRETWFCYRMMGYRTNRQFVRLPGHPKYNRNT
jgi:hypothetical protein